MAFGISVRTTSGSGLQDLASINSARVVRVLKVTTYEGQITVPNFNSNRGDFYPVNYDDRFNVPAMKFNNTTKVFEWWNHTPFNSDSLSNNFYVLFVENK